MDPAAGFAAGLVDGGIQPVADQKIRAVGVQTDPGEIWPVARPEQPRIDLYQVDIAAQEAGDENDARTVPARHAKSVIKGSGVQQEKFEAYQRFLPDRERGCRTVLAHTVLARNGAPCNDTSPLTSCAQTDSTLAQNLRGCPTTEPRRRLLWGRLPICGGLATRLSRLCVLPAGGLPIRRR